MSWTEIIDGCGCCNCCGTARVFVSYEEDGGSWVLAGAVVYWLNADGTSAGSTSLTPQSARGQWAVLPLSMPQPSDGDALTVYPIDPGLSCAIDCGTVVLGPGTAIAMTFNKQSAYIGRFESGYITVCAE